MSTLDDTGLYIDTYTDIKAAIEVSELASIDSQLNLTASSVIGQLNAIFAAKLSQLEEALLDVYTAMSPDSATGASLDNLAALCPGTTRTAAAYATLTATCTLTAGTYPIGSLIMSSHSVPTLRYSNSAEIVSVGGATAGCAFTATEAGAEYNKPLADLIDIAQPVTGWTAVAATTDATGGLDTESDYDLRLRREQTIRRSGSSHVDAIAADILLVTGVESAMVLENDTDTVSGSIPAHGVQCIYWDGSGAAASAVDVATAIFESKAAGIATGGASHQHITDTLGNSHTIYYDRATALRLVVEITGLTKTGYPSTWLTDLQTRLISTVNGGYDYDGITPITGLGIGGDVIYSKIYSAVLSLPWVTDVTSIHICWFGGAHGVVNLTVADTEVAQLSSADISLV